MGAMLDDKAGDDSGSLYVFRRIGTSWLQEAKLAGRDTAARDDLGNSVALDGDTLVAGAIGDDVFGLRSGSAYVFQRRNSGWTQQAELAAGNIAAGDEFGAAVSASGETVVIGSPWGDEADMDSGAAYVFEHNGATWTQKAGLGATDIHFGDEVGFSVALDGDTVVIGAIGNDDAGLSSGSVHMY